MIYTNTAGTNGTDFFCLLFKILFCVDNLVEIWTRVAIKAAKKNLKCG